MMMQNHHIISNKSNSGALLSLALYESLCCPQQALEHYTDVIMGVIASQITGLSIVYSIAYSGAY